MKLFSKILFSLLLCQSALAGNVVFVGTADNSTTTSATQVYEDDTRLEFGTNSDYHFIYDSANSRLEFNSTNVDGNGSDGIVFSVDDETDVINFTDGATFGGNTFLGDNNFLVFGNTRTSPDVRLGWNTAQTVNSLFLGLSTGQNNLIIAEDGDRDFNFSVAAQTNPTLTVFSAAQNTTMFWRLTHDQTNTVFTSGAGAVVVNATALLPDANNAFALGASGTGFSDVFLADGAVININAGATTLTETGGGFTVSGSAVGDNIFMVEESSNGSAIFRASNATTGSSADAVFRATVSGASGGDAYVSLTAVSDWTVGIDNSESDNFVISNSAVLGTSNVVSYSSVNSVLEASSIIDISSSEAFLVRENGDGGDIFTVSTNGAGDNFVQVNQLDAGSPSRLIIRHSDNTNTLSHAQLSLQTGGPSGGDPFVNFLSGVEVLGNWSFGMDNSDSNAIKLSNSSVLETDTILRIDTTSFDPGADNDMALGSSGRRWTQLNLGTGGVLNFESGDVTVTGGSNTLNFFGADSGYSFSGGPVIMGNDVLIRRDTNAGLTASTTQTQGQGPLTAEINEVSTVANTNDTVTLVTAFTGQCQIIINNGANTLRIFPASGDNLGAGVDTATTLASGANVKFCAYNATNWESI